MSLSAPAPWRQGSKRGSTPKQQTTEKKSTSKWNVQAPVRIMSKEKPDPKMRKMGTYQQSKNVKKIFEASYISGMRGDEVDKRNPFKYSSTCTRLTRGHTFSNVGYENQMLKNDIININIEVAELLDKLKKAEGDLTCTSSKLRTIEEAYNLMSVEKQSLAEQLNDAKRELAQRNTMLVDNIKESVVYKALEEEFKQISNRNKELQEQLSKLESSNLSNTSIQKNLEDELRYAQVAVKDLQGEVDKWRNETSKLSSDLQAYKNKIKKTLNAKDDEIQALQKMNSKDEDSKLMIDQLESMRSERDQLSVRYDELRKEYHEVKGFLCDLEARAQTSERLVAALREAFRDEREARCRAEKECSFYNKQLKVLQMDSGELITKLERELRDKTNELQKYQLMKIPCTASTGDMSEVSTLNVAEQKADSVSSEKIQLLTQTLMSKQGIIDRLIGESNQLKTLVEEMQKKHNEEIRTLLYQQDPVHLAPEKVPKANDSCIVATGTMISKMSLNVGAFMKRHPILRFTLMVYMAVLHMWVLLVFTLSAPGV